MRTRILEEMRRDPVLFEYLLPRSPPETASTQLGFPELDEIMPVRSGSVGPPASSNDGFMATLVPSSTLAQYTVGEVHFANDSDFQSFLAQFGLTAYQDTGARQAARFAANFRERTIYMVLNGNAGVVGLAILQFAQRLGVVASSAQIIRRDEANDAQLTLSTLTLRRFCPFCEVRKADRCDCPDALNRRAFDFPFAREPTNFHDFAQMVAVSPAINQYAVSKTNSVASSVETHPKVSVLHSCTELQGSHGPMLRLIWKPEDTKPLSDEPSKSMSGPGRGDQTEPETEKAPQQAPLEKGYSCSKCGRVFKQNFNLLRHTRTVHERHKPHLCHLCGAQFSQACDLKRHRRVHIRKGENIDD